MNPILNRGKLISFLSLLFLAPLLQVHAAEDKPRIEGIIMGNKGVPLSNALVTVFSAKPREGEATICAECYPDCGKHARTDAAGRFVIEPLNPDLLYRLAVVAKAYRPDYIKDADPTFGDVELRLKPRKYLNYPLTHHVTGKIVDTEGRPVISAAVTVDGYRDERMGAWGGSYGSVSGRTDSLAITDENGEFVVYCTNGVSSIIATLDARGLAKRRMWLDAGKAHLIRMKKGVVVTGRLLKDKEPLAGVKVAMNTEERESSVFMRGWEVATDKEGRFLLPNVPSNMRFNLYTRMKDMSLLGVGLPTQPVSTGADETTLKLGDLAAKPGHKIHGRIVMSDGQPVPLQTQIYLGLENGYDSQNLTVGEDGAFDFGGVPAEQLALSIRVRNYRVSSKNPNKDWLNPGRIVGRLEGDLNDFIIHLEPGDFERDAGPADGSDRQPTNKPLRGAKL
jgi:hypothetical protein